MGIYLGNKKVSMRGIVVDNSKLAQLASGKITEITAKDLEGATIIRPYFATQLSSLISIEIPNTITRINMSAFSQCFKLESVTIPNSVTDIGMSAFESCEKLMSITIPSSVTSISSNALRIGSSTNKATIRMLGDKPPTIQSTTIGSNVGKIIVDPGTLSIWQNATNWSAKASIMEEEVV